MCINKRDVAININILNNDKLKNNLLFSLNTNISIPYYIWNITHVH